MKLFLPKTVLFTVVVLLFTITNTTAQTTFDWMDTAPDGNWRQGASGARWFGGGCGGGCFDEPGFGILRFNNNHQLNMTNNVPGTYNIHQIVFGASNTSNRTITGSNIVRFFDSSGADPKIENLSSASHTISFNIISDDGTDPLEINPVNGNLTFNNTITNSGNSILIFGNNGFTARFNNIISGAGAFIIRQNSKVIFNDINTYTGNTELDNGELWIETTGNAIANNNIFVGRGDQLANVAKMFLSRAAGGTTFSRNININPGNANTRFLGGLNTSGTNTFSGNIVRSAAQPLNIEVVNAGGTVAFTGLINGSGNITKIGPGTATLSTTNSTFTGSLIIENGLFSVDNFPARINSRPITLGATSTSGSFRFTSTSGASSGLVLSTAAGGGSIENNTATNFTLSGTNTLTGTITYNSSSTGNTTVSGIHSGAGGLIVASTGSGKVILGGNNTYTGTTRVNSGILETNGTTRIANTSNMILAGGTFSSGATIGYSEQVGTLQLLANSTIALGTGNHTLTFANSSAVGWTGGTALTINGWTGSAGVTGTGAGGKIQVGVGGLTATQLAQINFTGYATGAVLTATGEVVPSDYRKYYSKGSTAPNLVSSWSLTPDGTGDAPADFAGSNEFIIQDTHAMVTSALWNLTGGGAKVTIQNGGSLESTFAVTIPDTGIFQIDNGGTYFHNNTAAYSSTILQGIEIFGNSSTFVYKQIGTFSSANNVTYGNVTIDSNSLSANIGLGGHLQTINGNFSILNTNNNQVRLANNGTSLNVTGNFILNGSTANIVLKNNTDAGNQTITVNGNVQLLNGTFSLTNNASGGAAYFIVRGENFEISNDVIFAGTLVGSSGFYLNRIGSQNIVIANALATGSHRDRFYYNTTNVTGINETYNGTVAQSTVSGTGATPLAGYAAWPTTGTVLKNFTVNNSAGVTLRNDRNVNETLFMTSGDLTGTGIVSYASGATLHYNGTAAKTSTDVEFPSLNGPSNLIIGNPAGVTLHATKTLTGNLTVNNSGIFDLGANTIDRNTSGGSLTLGSSTALTIGGTNSFPANYDTHSVNATSTVEYNGANQTIAVLNSSQAYGNLVLSGNGIKSFGGNVVATNLTNGINAVTTVAANQNVTVNDVLTNNGTFTVANNANLIQVNDTNNVGAITVNRNSSALMRLDYTLWSSPVANQNLLSFSPLTMANRFYVYNPSNNQYAAVTPSSTNFAEGTGYLIRMPDNHPTSPTTWSGSFVGVPHNGDVTITVTNNTYNAVGNPYPSTIDADDFINDNNLTEALYFWRKTNAAAGSAYATYTLAGGAGTGGSGSSSQIPNGIIQVGQGFIARSTSTALVFNNLMRVADNNNQFFRSANNVTKSRIWLNLNQQNNILGQTMVAYMEGTTTDLDAKYDGKYINDSQTAITSVINNEEYAVQARGEFAATDVVPMTIKLETAGNYTISLAQVDGVFSTEHDIFVRDIELGVEHDIRTAPYSFSAPAGVLTNRFELVYQSTLSVENPTFNNVAVFSKNKALEINAGNETISSVTVFDIRGRKVAAQEEVNTSAASLDLSGVANQVLIVQIKTSNGQLITKKVVH